MVWRIMEKIQENVDYCGELKLDCDKVNNFGANWYVSQALLKRATTYSKIQPISNYGEQSTGYLFDDGINVAAEKIKKSNCYEPRFRLENLNFVYIINEGAFGKVWQATLKTMGTFAIKQFDLHKISIANIWKERDLLIFLRHKTICNIAGAFYDSDPFLVLECCFSNLRIILSQLNDRNILRFGTQLAQALSWIHSKNVVHCNIQPKTCLVSTSNNLVLSGFTNAIILLNGINVAKSMHFRGKIMYQDYESNTQMTYSRESDLFSFACILFEMVTKEQLVGYSLAVIPLAEYIKVYTLGRYIDLLTWPPTVQERESLIERAKRLTPLYSPLFGMLLTERKTRCSAKTFLESSVLNNMLHGRKLCIDNLDNDLDMVTFEFKHNGKTNFLSMTDSLTEETFAAFHGFYYDEIDALDTNIERMATTSYDAHIVAKFLSQTNSVPQLEGALARDEKVANSQLLKLASEWLGLSFAQSQTSSFKKHSDTSKKDNTQLKCTSESKSKRHKSASNRKEIIPLPQTVNIRRSNRVPSQGKILESLYDKHLMSSTQCGLQKIFIDANIGYGIFTTKTFYDKEFIIEYKGTLLSNAEARHRFTSLPEELGSYIFFLGKTYSNQCIDATHNLEFLGRYINHSKRNANCKVLCRMLNKKPRIFLVATKTIPVGSQLLYDYNDKNKDFPFLFE